VSPALAGSFKRAFRKTVRLRFESGRKSYRPGVTTLAFTDWRERDDEIG
jgi:hypothetical protein